MSLQPNDSKMTRLYQAAIELHESLELEQVLHRALIAAARVVGAAHGSFFVFDRQEYLLKSLFVDGETVIDVNRQVVYKILAEGLAGWVKKHKEATLVENTQTDLRWYADAGNPDLLLHHSAVSVPLLTGQRVLGIITITHEQPYFFKVDDVALLTALAEQAATAILNARLYQAEQHRRQLYSTLTDVFTQMNTTHNLDELFHFVLTQLAYLIDYDQSAIFLRHKRDFTIAAASGIDNLAEIQDLPVELYPQDFAAPVIKRLLPVYTPDLQQEYSWFKDVTDVYSRSWLGIPMVVGNNLQGIITVASRHPALYTDAERHIVNTLAGQAAVAIHNASLLTQLQDTKKRYTHLFEESSDLLLILSPTGIIIDANRKACQLLRRPKDVLIDSQLALLDPSLRPVFADHSAKLKPGKEIVTEITIKDAYGQPLVLEINAKQIEINQESAVQWAGRDVTARQQLINLRQDLTNMIVHDLRGPTGTLMGTVQLLSMVLQDVDNPLIFTEAMELINIATRSGQYLEDLISSVLDLQRLEQGELPLTITPVFLADIFLEVREQIRPQAELKQIEISFQPAPVDLAVPMDQGIIRRVLVNLIDNAIKYTPSKGQVTVNFLLDDTLFTISVTDTGPGIPTDSQKRIFDKFTRATNDTTIQGVGLGLAFCKLAVEAHQGHIWLESRVGIGSTFSFTIPCTPPTGD